MTILLLWLLVAVAFTLGFAIGSTLGHQNERWAIREQREAEEVQRFVDRINADRRN